MFVIRADGGGYYGWNSFKSRPYVTTLKCAENFEWRERAIAWADNLSGAIVLRHVDA
jgi:hypothetical protein